MGRTTARLKHTLTRLERGHTKVSNLDDFLAPIKKQVLRLEITVADTESMAVVHTEDNLSEIKPRLVRTQPAAGDQIVKELTASDVLHDQVEFLASFVYVPETKQVRVFNKLHDHNFTLDTEREFILLGRKITQAHATVEKHLLRDDLYGRGLLRTCMHCKTHTARSTLPDELTELPRSDSRGIIVTAFLLAFKSRCRPLGRGARRCLSNTRRDLSNAWRGDDRRRRARLSGSSLAVALTLSLAVAAERVGRRLQWVCYSAQH
jgi:hypothetical protein